MNKGRWTYLIIILINLMMMCLPSSTSFFRLVIQDIQKNTWLMWLPDIIAVLSLLAGYFVLKLFYKERSGYIKNYPYLGLVILLAWTALTQIK